MENVMKKRCFIIMSVVIFFSLLFFVISPAETQATTTVQEIKANPSRFDGRMVEVVGVAENLIKTVSRRGNKYYTINLTDKKSSIKVFNFGEPSFEEGDKVIVKGVFLIENRVRNRVFRNEIDASKGGSVNKIR